MRHIRYIAALALIALTSCSGGGGLLGPSPSPTFYEIFPLPNTDVPATEISIEATATAPATRVPTPLPDDLNLHLSYAAGGAGSGSGWNFGEANCNAAEFGGVELQMTGILSMAGSIERNYYDPDRGHVPTGFWWGGLPHDCSQPIGLGDMIFFTVTGIPIGETVTFTLTGPNGETTVATSEVMSETRWKDSLFTGAGNGPELVQLETARFSWIPSPEDSPGSYTLITGTSEGEVRLDFAVIDRGKPNFGLLAGSTGRPLILSQQEQIELVYAGFAPDSQVLTLLFRDHFDEARFTDYCVFDPPAHGFDSDYIQSFSVPVNSVGNAIYEMEWPADLPPGLYSLLVPDIIPDLTERLRVQDTVTMEGYTALQFCVGEPRPE